MIRLIILLIVLCSGTSQAAANELSFRGNGQAVVIDNQISDARRLAGQAARVKAIENGIKKIIRDGSIDEKNYFLNKGKLLTPPFDYIRSTKVLNERRADQLIFVELAVVVDQQAFYKALGKFGLLATRVQAKNTASFPTIMLIGSEQITGTTSAQPYSFRVISDQLRAKGFRMVQQSQVARSIKHDQAVQAILRADARAAQAMALQFEAGIVVTVSAVASRGGIKAGGMHPYSANVTLQAIEADTGRVLASSGGNGSYPHIDLVTGSRKALEEASQDAVKALVENLSTALQSTQNQLLVNVNNVSYQQAALLKKILTRDFKNIESIQQQSYIGRTAKYQIELFGAKESFVDKLALHKFPSFKIQVISYSANKLDLELHAN